MSTQLLVNVLTVGPLGVGDSVTLPHGLRSNDTDVAPTLIQPDRATPIVVDPLSVTDTTVTFTNNGTAPAEARFRCERGLSNEVDAETVGTSYWQGVVAGGGGGGVSAVTATAPITATGFPVTDVGLLKSSNFVTNGGGQLDLANTAVTAGSYGDLAAANQSSVPTFTVDAKGRLTAAAAGAIKIGGSDAKTYVDAQDAATLAAANTFAENLAFGISSKEPAHVATDVALPLNTQVGITLVANGVGPFPTVDGETILVGQRVLVKNEGTQSKNGIYVLIDGGSPTTPWTLQRSADANTASELCGSIIPVETGTQAGTVWLFASNSVTFIEWTTPVVWVELTVGAATAGTLGIVQLAAGLGGGGPANAPTLNVDHVGAGTLPALRGGTGQAGSGGIGNDGKVLTADGAGGWAIEDVPATNTTVAQVYFVTANGNDTTGDGSIAKPLATVAEALVRANAAYTSGEFVQINVGPGSYTGFTLNRKNTFIQGVGARPEDQGTKFTSPVTITPAGATLLYNEQVSIDGCFIQSTVNTPAVDITAGPICTVTITNSYLTTLNTGASANALRCSAASKVVVQNCSLTTQSPSTSPVVEVSAGDVRIVDSQVINAGQTDSNKAAFIDASGASTLFVERVIAEQSFYYTSRGIILSGRMFQPYPAGYYKASVTNSSIRLDGFVFYWTAITEIAFTPYVQVNNVFAVAPLVDPTSSVLLMLYAGNIFGGGVPNFPLAPAQAPLTQIISGPTYVATLGASSFVKTDLFRQLVSVSTLAGSDFGSQPANFFFAAPNGVSGDPIFRAIVAADLPPFPYDVAGSIYGQWLASDTTVFLFKATRALTLSATDGNHKFTAKIGATTQADFILYKNSVAVGQEILTASFAAGGGSYQTATVTMSGTTANYSIGVNELLILVAPSPVDATLADIFWTLSATA